MQEYDLIVIGGGPGISLRGTRGKSRTANGAD